MGSVTVFADHADDDIGNRLRGHVSTHTVTCRTSGCPRKGIPTTVPLPGHKSGKKRLREQVFCGECGQAIWWSEVKAKE